MNFFSVENAIVLLYLTCSGRDVDWLRDGLDYVLSSQGIDTRLHLFLHERCTEQLVCFDHSVDAVDPVDATDLPWDPRWFQQICLRHFGCGVNDENPRSRASNR